MKSQPLAFNKDQQELKPPLTDTFETVRAAVTVTAQMIATIKVRKDRMLAAANQGYSTATDLADYLVRAGVPFRDAHQAVAAIVGRGTRQGAADVSELSLVDMQTFAPLVGEDVFQVLTVEGSVASRVHKGGTAPRRVREAVDAVRRAIA